MLQTFTPAATTADGNCMYRALSRLVCGNERLSVVFRILTAYATAKYRDLMIDALHNAFPLQEHEALLYSALRMGSWGIDFHLILLSILLDRPIFIYFTFYNNTNGVRSLTLADCTDVNQFASRFLAYNADTRRHMLHTTNMNRALLRSGDVTTLPQYLIE